ncbi:MAG: hypothetical protein GY750_00465 [Lentisphaerae bacterium]|nr:hypothetical protein [Lentisphaerota bacterium]MCP4099893.1 hypothetical protein [Lentisphaerota bacterium]
MARESIVQANDHFRQSSSKMYRFGDYNMAFHSNEQQITSHRKKVHNIMRKPELLGGKALDKSDPMKEIESMVQNSLKYSVANCSEMASFCYLLLHHYAKLGLIKFKDMGIFKLPHADHVFLIIVPLGEELLPWKFKSTYAKIKSSKALVCDPWVKSFFYLKDYHKIIGNHFISLVKNFAYSSLKKYKLSTSFDLERCLLINNGVEELLDLVKSCKEAMSYFIFNKSDKKDNFEKLIEYIQKKKAISYQDYSYVLRKVISTALENRNSLRNKPGSSSECLKKINFYPQMKNVIGKQLGMNLNGGQLDYKSMVKYSEINNNEITV